MVLDQCHLRVPCLLLQDRRVQQRHTRLVVKSFVESSQPQIRDQAHDGEGKE